MIIIEITPNTFENLLKEAGNSKVMFVILIGSYQTWKSTKIAKLMNSKEVKIGDGIDETTYGAYVYGPVDLNDLKRSFDCNTNNNDDTKVFFIDTEGANGFETGMNVWNFNGKRTIYYR